MQKAGIICFLFLVLGVSCMESEIEFQSNNDSQQIVGTWKGINSNGDIHNIVFDSDGSYGASGRGAGNGNYFLSGGKLVFSSGRGATVTDYYLSQDGKNIVFLSSGYLVWFEKQ